MKKKILFFKLALSIPLFFLISLWCQKATDRFTIHAIRSHRPFHPEWEGAPLSTEESEEVDRALSQPFSYYGCGGQSFIFFSHDDKYVLKFFKERLYTYPKWLDYLPVPYLLNRYKSKKR